MSKRRIIDFHTHAFPDALASATMDKLSKISGCTPCTAGTVQALEQYIKENEFEYGVLLQIANRPNQYMTVNNWAAEVHRKHPSIFAFGSIHPEDGENGIQELSRFQELGLKGVKFHPDYQKFFVDEARMRPIYEACGNLQLPVLFHAGWDPLSPEVIHATPERIAHVVKQLPNTTFIAAHLAGMKDTKETIRHLAGLPLYLDISMACTYLPPEEILSIIRLHGSDRILFATDCPWGDPQRNVSLLESLPLTPSDLDNIFWNNAVALLKLETAQRIPNDPIVQDIV